MFVYATFTYKLLFVCWCFGFHHLSTFMCATASGVSYGTSLTQLQKNGKKKSRWKREREEVHKRFQWTMKMRCDCTHLATQSRSEQRQNKNVICKKRTKERQDISKKKVCSTFSAFWHEKNISVTFFYIGTVYIAYFFLPYIYPFDRIFE